MINVSKLILSSAIIITVSGCSSRPSTPSNIQIKKGEELMCQADTEQQALKIAEDYQIELVSWSDGIAVFHTNEDPQSLIEYGKANGLNRLSLNTENNKYAP